MATKRDLEREVKRLNDLYCKNTKNHLEINQAYNGYSVVLTGKSYKRGNKEYYVKNSLGSGEAEIGNQWHDTASKTIAGLYKADSRGWIKNQINYYERRKKV